MTEETATSTDQETPPCPSWCVEVCSHDNGMGPMEASRSTCTNPGR